jgi:mono/diheme cytochrome c family protein
MRRTKEQVAAVVTYIRSDWGSPAASVSADDVRKQRDALAQRID